MSVYSFGYKGTEFEYTVTRKKVKNINIHINENCQIAVSAPYKTDIEYIRAFVESKGEWIYKNMVAIEKYNISKPDSEIYTGKKVYFLGKEYIVKIIASEKNHIYIENDSIVIYSSHDGERLKKQYMDFLKIQAQEVFLLIVQKAYFDMKEERLPKFTVLIRNMKTRWGTCNIRTNVVTLNLQLIKTDIACIYQVVCHELTHFKIHNHGKDFYNILEKYVPNWKELKKDMNTRYKDGI